MIIPMNQCELSIFVAFYSKEEGPTIVGKHQNLLKCEVQSSLVVSKSSSKQISLKQLFFIYSTLTFTLMVQQLLYCFCVIERGQAEAFCSESITFS